MKNILVAAAIALAAFIAAVAVWIASGQFNVAADEEHSGFVYWLIETTRERSIAVRTSDIRVPELGDAQRIRRGAGNYDAMCAGCHLTPGAKQTELSRGLYPQPPDLTKDVQSDAGRAFWIIKHGIKSTGMPAWGKSMEDEHIWDLVALVRALPELTPDQYRAEVRASEGHSHGGGESMQRGGEAESRDESGSGHSHEAEETEHSHEHGEEKRSHEAAGAGADRADGMDATDNRAAALDAPIAVAKALHTALSSGNTAQVERLLAPDVLIMEAGNVERSRKEYAAHHLQSDAKFMKQVSYRLNRQTTDAAGTLAWVASEARISGGPADKPVDLLSTETLVMKKFADEWRIVHIHWSSRNAKKG